MKKVFVALILMMCCVTFLLLGVTRAFSIAEDEGYAMPADAGIARALAGSGGGPVSLVKIQYDDIIYSSLTGYYVGAAREKIDLSYPLYTSGGAGLRFLNEENWLITADVDLFQSFDGLYLSNGVSYNADMTQADDGEFILLALDNDLYMNAQQAVFENALGQTVIPLNSILLLSEESIAWYEQKNGALTYRNEEAVFNAVITIGSHTYRYTDLLDALGLLRHAIESGENGQPDIEDVEEANEILNRNEQGSTQSGSGKTSMGNGSDQIADTAQHQPGEGTNDEDAPLDDTASADGSVGDEDSKDSRTDRADTSGRGSSDSNLSHDDPSGSGTSGATSDSGRSDSSSSGSSSSGSGSSGSGSSGSSSSGGSSSGGSSSGGGSSGNGTSGNSSGGDPSGGGNSDSSSGGGSGDDSGDSSGDPGGGGDGGDSEPVPYQPPAVTLTAIEPWSYAIGLDMVIDDPSGAILRGVSFTVYRSVKGSGQTSMNECGYTTYPSDSYEGKSAMLRKSKTGSQAFALSTLQPGQTVYLQYSYRYTAEETDEAGAKRNVRKYAYSDLVEIALPTVEAGNVEDVRADWTVRFAAQSDALELDSLTLKNTSAYDAEAERYSFANFKLNTLPYVNRLELKLTPKNGKDAVTVVVGATALSKAQKDGGTVFTSSSPKLSSNTEYTYTVTAKDRYGNAIALDYPKDERVCTRKAAPTVTITEVENVTDSLTVQITVSDPDGALVAGEPLTFTATDSKTGVAAALYGEWDTNTVSDGGEDVYALKLQEPEDESSYTLTLDSLAFSCLYALEVCGSYAPQPDVENASETLAAVEDALLGRTTVYTAALSSGLISFQSGVIDLMDTSATLTAKMTSDTTLDILPLVDEFRVILKDKSGTTVSTTVLDYETLSTGEGYKYDRDMAMVCLEEGSYTLPSVALYGLESQYLGTPWNSFLIAERVDEEAGSAYTSPMELRVMTPAVFLKNHTDYTFSIQAVVKKSGEEYLIPVSMTNNSFTTKKTLPQVEYSDLFLAADVAEFLDLRIEDPDETILNDGAVTVYLYYGSTILSAKRFNANSDGFNLRFDGLIAGGKYTLKFVASAYNDADGYGSYQTNYLLATYELTAGSALSGTLTLHEAHQSAGGSGQYVSRLGIEVRDLKGYLGREGESGAVTLTIERSDSMELPSYEKYLTEQLPLTKNANGSLSLNTEKLLESLPADTGWRATLSATYQGSTILLDEITFRTDADYVVVSNHEELLAAQEKYPYANILVDSDFVQDQDTYVPFYGIIDFQGHTVTKGDNINTYFLYSGIGSRIVNLVYDYPEQAYYVNKGAVFQYVWGTVENLIVRTHGQVETTVGSELVSRQMSDGSVLKNFIVRLGGDLVCTAKDQGAIVRLLTGTVENGYIYGKNGAGFVTRGSANSIALFGDLSARGQIHNIYVLLDSWHVTGSSNVLFSSSSNGLTGAIRNIYAVGDYYQVGVGEAKSYLLPSATLRLVRSDASATIFEQVWALTSRSYEAQNKVDTGTAAKLYDAAWQQELLGDAFDVDGCVSMGFYPRLELPASMQKYQEYLPLPALGQEMVPQLVSDDWADEPYTHGLDMGYLKLRFRNDANLQITRVSIDGLITEVVSQSAAADGLYDVIVNAQVDPEKPSYQSQYTVSAISYVSTSGARDAQLNYKTTGIEFWKSVATATEWSAINNNMDWNYKLTADIDFAASGLTAGAITLNGKFEVGTGKEFTGKIDGQEHILKNIKLENMKYPYLIYQTNGAEIRNLLVEDVCITADSKMSDGYSGLIRYAYKSTIENVRMKGCELAGGGCMGLLAGYSYYTTIRECSAVDSTVRDVGDSRPVYAGGLLGNCSWMKIENCYTRDIHIEITKSLVVNGVGGLFGYAYGYVANCYAHGSIEAAGSYVGGVAGTCGSSPTVMTRCWSYVDILQTSGSYAAGVFARASRLESVISLGDVSGADADTTRRVAADLCNADQQSRTYAYGGQLCGNLGESEPGERYVSLLSDAALGSANTWQDKIRLGAEWDYTPVSHGCAPKLLADCASEGWQQQDIYLPSQSDDPTLRLVDALYNENNDFHFQLQVQLEHPGLTSEKVTELYKARKLTVALDGMDLSDAAINMKNASIELSQASDGEATLLTIQTKEFTKALDSYRLTVSYTDPNDERARELNTMVEYKTQDGKAYSPWWEVENLDAWNALMPEHGKTGENVRITGTIDFSTGTTGFNELSFNRLTGKDDTCGFTGLRYSGGNDGVPWIEKVSIELTDIFFRDMYFVFSEATASRAMTGAILSVGEVSGLKLETIELKACRYTRAYFGFISNVSGSIGGVTMTGVTLNDVDQGTGNNYNYCGGLAAYCSQDVENVSVSDIKITMPKNYYTGGIIGCQGQNYKTFSQNKIDQFSVIGNKYVGSLAGQAFPGYSDSNEAENGSVAGTDVVGGLGGNFQTLISYINHEGCRVSGVEVTASGGQAGGISGSLYNFYASDVVVKDCTITGTTFVGGTFAGIGNGCNVVLKDVQIIETRVKNVGTGAVNSTSMGTGALLGCVASISTTNINGVVVRDCTVEGPGYVGGLVGTMTRMSSGATYQRIFVAEDVTVTATGSGPAGGIFGSADYFALKDSACGATVTAKNAAGGIIGQLEPQSNQIVATLTNVYYRGCVTATADYAGGVVGKLNSGSLKLTDSNMKNVLVAADVRCGGSNGSLWVNSTNTSASAGTGLIYICEDSLLNGQTAKAIVAAAAAEGKTVYAAPQRPAGDTKELMVSAADFGKADFYSSRGFGSGAWDYTDLREFMPYPKNSGGTGVAESAQRYDDEAVGIPLPEGGSIGKETVVYASGANTVNIETGLANTPVSVNEKTCTADENGVITLVYDFSTELKVNAVTYAADTLSRKVMTYGNYWYYIDTNGNVHYGLAVKSEASDTYDEIGTVEGITACHLWQGCALTTDGEVVQLNGNGRGVTSSGTMLEIITPSQPFWKDGDTQVYYYFSLYKGQSIPFRVFSLDGAAYTVSPAQNTVYDGVVLSAKTEFGETSRYFALLGKETGVLTAYLSSMKLGGITNGGIAHISNSLGYDGTVLLTCYDNGNVVGVDYTTGVTVCSTLPAVQSFMAYAMRTVLNLGRFVSGNTAVTDGSFYDGENTRTELSEDGQYDSSGAAPITDSGSGEGGSAVPTNSANAEGVNAAGNSVNAGGAQPDGAAVGVDGVAVGTDGSVEADGSGTDGGTPNDAGNAKDTSTEHSGDPVGASDAQSGPDAGGNGSDDAVKETSDDGKNAGIGTEVAPTSGLSAGSNAVSGESGRNGSAANEADGANGAGTEASNSASENKYTDSSTELILENALYELFGDSVVAYSEYTGQYELLDTASLSTGEQIKRTDALAADHGSSAEQSADAQKDAEQAADGEKHPFSVAWGINRSLDADERQGFALIAFAAGIGVCVLALLYVKVIRKRRK